MPIATRRCCASLLFAVLAQAGLPHDARAVSLVPMEMEFATSGRGATRLFRIENLGAENAAVEVSAKSRRMTADGQDQLDDADDAFAIYPQQMILKPGQVQTIRVQWLGKTAPAQELAYRLIAEQLPLDGQAGLTANGPTTAPAAAPAPRTAPTPAAATASTPTPQSVQIRVLMKYVASVYVVPPGARAEIVAVGAERVSVHDQTMLRLVLENRGTAHQVLLAPRLTLSGADGVVRQLEAHELQPLIGANLLAGSRRVFDIPLPPSLPVEPLRLTLTSAPRAASQSIPLPTPLPAPPR